MGDPKWLCDTLASTVSPTLAHMYLFSHSTGFFYFSPPFPHHYSHTTEYTRLTERQSHQKRRQLLCLHLNARQLALALVGYGGRCIPDVLKDGFPTTG